MEQLPTLVYEEAVNATRTARFFDRVAALADDERNPELAFTVKAFGYDPLRDTLTMSRVEQDPFLPMSIIPARYLGGTTVEVPGQHSPEPEADAKPAPVSKVEVAKEVSKQSGHLDLEADLVL